MNGIINLDKPPAMSSARAVAKAKRLLLRNTKIGHAGTLDPFATGVLLLLIGRATKMCERLMDQPKGYETAIKFGATTATFDPETEEIPWPDAQPVSRDAVEAVIRRFVGEIQQTPPAYSAMKFGGRRAYDLARKGHDVQLQPRTVRIYGIEICEYDWPLLRLRIECGRGAYVRALARDIGEALNVGGYLRELRRTHVGEFRVKDAVSLDQLIADGVEKHLRAI